MHPLRVFAVAAILLSPSGFAAAAEGCPAPKVCTPDEYPILRPNGICPPDPKGDRVERICQPIEEAPGAFMHCTRSWSGYNCAGWPRGEVTHHWSVALPMTLQGLPNSETAVIKCNGTRGSTVTLTVTSPVGLSSTTSVSLSCDRTIEQ